MTSNSAIPGTLRVTASGQTVTYRLTDDHHAVCGERPRDQRIELESPEDSLWVVAKRGPAGGPVYRREPGGELALPTGRVFLVAAKGSDVRDLVEEITDVGFRIRDVPAYAPHAAWLEPVEGGVGFALARYRQLEEIADVESASPQILTRVQSR